METFADYQDQLEKKRSIFQETIYEQIICPLKKDLSAEYSEKPVGWLKVQEKLVQAESNILLKLKNLDNAKTVSQSNSTIPSYHQIFLFLGRDSLPRN